VTGPPGDQTISQSPNTNLNVNRFEKIRFADQFPGFDIGAKVNAAITDLGSGGGVVEIPAGSYSFSTTIEINQSYTWVRCQGWATVLTYTGTGTAVIIGNSSSPGTSPATIYAVRFSNCTLRGQGSGTGIYVESRIINGSGTSIDHVNFDSGGNGFQTFIELGDYAEGGTSYDNYIQNNRILLNNGQSSSYSGVGIDVPMKSHNLVISDNIIQDQEQNATNPSDSSICVRVANSSSVKIINNNIEGCGTANVQVGLTQSGTLQTYGTLVAGNYFEPLHSSTLDVDVGKYATGTIIEGNYMNGDGSQNHLIQIEDCSYATVIQNNTQLSVATSAVNNLTSSCGNAITIAGNRFNGSTYIQGTTGISYWQDPNSQSLTLGSVTYSHLPSARSKPNGTLMYCSNCNIASSCSSGGNGAIAKTINGAWVCN
jgi:hypothetical protein